MSLSQDPTFSLLKDYFVCGYNDIEKKLSAGSSHAHLPSGAAVDTTNGAGPHNIQIFVLADDGTVLHCLPGYWNSQDLAEELKLAAKLNDVWHDEKLTREQKDQVFVQLQLAHVHEHSPAMVSRSHMQSFDVMYEVKNRPWSDVFKSKGISASRLVMVATKHASANQVKTTDVIMHERMAKRPFRAYADFDAVAYSDYGKPFYDKHENRIVCSDPLTGSPEPVQPDQSIGNTLETHPFVNGSKKVAQIGLKAAIHAGISAALHY